MTSDTQAGVIAGKVHLSVAIIYAGFRLLGASKKHAWERARIAVASAVIDKAVEMTGVKHPGGVPAGQMQITFDGGPAHREVRNVPICGTVRLASEGQQFDYLRTERTRGQSIVFELASGCEKAKGSGE